MENTHDQHSSQTTLARGGPLSDVCDAFEEELKHGRRPQIEQHLAGWEEPERSKLLYELLRLEIDWSRVRGQERSLHAFVERFPEHAEIVEEAFLATAAPEHSGEALTMTSTYIRRGFLGKGGLGIVYIAEDQQLNRDTAVKFIQDTVADNPRSREQFRLEAEITSRLEHPGIVPVHGLGETGDGRLFYVMRRIRGERLDEAIARFYQQNGDASAGSLHRHVRFHELLHHFVAVCKTVAYAHNRGVVHRDLKPGNIMLGRYGETLVIDWGLAAHVGRKGVFKDSNEKTLMPGSGSGSSQKSGGGTPPYMSPEQAGGRDDLGPASDVYSLGATLYTLLTGKAPFGGSDAAEIMDEVKRGEFPRPTQV
ncbi:MAG: serine/threonine protein kinase, partial [Planctomycetes bacterium]|nr:serine/threonine protein kinase [Planctomycetota bacterium]